MKWDKVIKSIYVKLTDKYIYIYSKNVKRYESFNIKNGKVDNVNKLIIYLKNILNTNFIKNKYIFILDTLLCNSDIFVYKYVFDRIGVIDYKIINDLDLASSLVKEDNIVIFNWSSSINYAYLNNKEIVVNPYNTNIINSLNKKYILLIGDTPISKNIRAPIYEYEYHDDVIFNVLQKES